MCFPGGKWIGAVAALWLFGLNAALAAAPPVVELRDGPEPLHLGRHLQVLREDGGKLTLDEVRSPQVAGGFMPSTADVPSFGFLKSPQWYRVALRAPAEKSTDWVLQLSYGTLDYVDIYINRGDGS